MKDIVIELRKIVTIILINWVIKICPKGEFKNELALFLFRNYHKL